MQPAIDETIQGIERLYESVTGQTAPAVTYGYAPIPPEANVTQHVEQQLSRLLSMVEQTPGPQSVASAVTAAPAMPQWLPPCSIRADGSFLVIELDVPGVLKQSIDVSVVKNAVTVSGNRALPWPDASAPSARFRMSERPFGAFRRTVVLPAGAKPDKLEAAMENGVLMLRVPSEREASPGTQPIPIHIPVK